MYIYIYKTLQQYTDKDKTAEIILYQIKLSKMYIIFVLPPKSLFMNFFIKQKSNIRREI